MILGVVIPTVDGREGYLARAVETHAAKPWPFATRVVPIVERGFETCGEAWNAGARALRESFGEDLGYLCFSADDLEAAPGWAEAGIGACERGELPAPILLAESGERDPRTDDGPANRLVAFSRVPFFRFETWLELGPCPPLHYYSDAYYGSRAGELGLRTRITAGFVFTHRWASEGRYGDERHDLDRRILETRGREHHRRLVSPP